MMPPNLTVSATGCSKMALTQHHSMERGSTYRQTPRSVTKWYSRQVKSYLKPQQLTIDSNYNGSNLHNLKRVQEENHTLLLTNDQERNAETVLY